MTPLVHGTARRGRLTEEAQKQFAKNFAAVDENQKPTADGRLDNSSEKTFQAAKKRERSTRDSMSSLKT